MEANGVGLASGGRRGEDRPCKTVAKGNDDNPEMDCRATAKGQFDRCVQPVGASTALNQ